MTKTNLRAVLGPTNTGKTHLAIERMCGHSSGVMGFPLRLLAQEVFARVQAIKGESQVALITGEQRIEPPQARYFCCTVEAMPRAKLEGSGAAAFVAVDEAQLAADRERGHIFTDRILNARGREETMILGSATLAPVLRTLEPDCEFIERPRFSTLKHIGARKLSRLPPRSAIVAFSAEQVYVVAEMLRRFRGGAAVVMGALSPETRNKQVAMFQNGEVDYIVATDAIGMGLNLDLNHVAFAGLSKFDGQRQRRLTPAEMAQIAGRAGRHQRDGTFGMLSGSAGTRGGEEVEFSDEEVYAIEEHRFAPLTRLFWRDSEPDFTDVDTLIADLERPPMHESLAAAPEAIDLAILKRLAAEPLAREIRGSQAVRSFWNVCSLPDFRQQGLEMHARFVARLWEDLRTGYLGADFVAGRIAQLDNVQGDIDTLQGRIAAVRTWAYICQRPDWVLARDEMAARARSIEARLSDALHARLTERFVNRRTAVLLRTMGRDAGLLPTALDDDDRLVIDGEVVGHLEGFQFRVDPAAGHEDHRMLVAAAEKALPQLLAERAGRLVQSGFAGVTLSEGALWLGGHRVASLAEPAGTIIPSITPARDLALLPGAARDKLMTGLRAWLSAHLRALQPLQALLDATRDPALGSQARALLHRLIEGHGYVSRREAGLDQLPKELRPVLRRLGVTFGALDIFVQALLKPGARQLLHQLGRDRRPLETAMPPISASSKSVPAGYRRVGTQTLRIDLAEKLVRAAHDARAAAKPHAPMLDKALAVSIGLAEGNWQRLLQEAGFRRIKARSHPAGASGPPAPDRWNWRPERRPPATSQVSRPPAGNAFASLADLVR